MSVALEKEFTFKTADFEAIRTRLKNIAGINLADSKDSMVYSRLARRIRALGLKSFAEYLKYVDKEETEHEEFVNALTTNLTSFFREKHHFDVLEKHLRSKPKTTPINIWCAASSTGEEPYSIAITAVKAFQTFQCPVNIIASDIDSKVLQTASNGVYREDQIASLDTAMKRQFFKKGTGNKQGLVKVTRGLRQLVSFKKINLMDHQWSLPNNFDVVFCRNVMIYFDKATQIEILKKILNHMDSDGLYIAGHSENFGHVGDMLVPLGQTVYKPKR